jgi:hypothetical protein
MRKPLTFMAALALSAVPAIAQSPSIDEKSPNQVEKAAALGRLHETLRTQSNLHDAYLASAGVGNEQSVPLLLERLRLDYGSAQPGNSSGAWGSTVHRCI